MNRKALKIAALFCAAGFFMTGCKSDDQNTVPKVNVAEFSKNDLSQVLSIDGSVESTDKNFTITTELVNYKVTSINFKVGDRVNEGDVVCELDSTELESEIAELEKIISDSGTLYDYRYQQLVKELENTKKSGDLKLKEANDRLSDARNNYNNYKSSYESNLGRYNDLTTEANSLKDAAAACENSDEAALYMEQYQAKMMEISAAMSAYETAYSAMEAAKESISMYENALESEKISVKGEIDAAQYNIDTYSLTANSSSDNTKKLEELKKSLENTKIKADKSGVISMINAEEGKVCQTGVIMGLQSTSDMCVHVNISEEDMLSVKKGMKAVITIPARKNDEYTGSVDRVIDIKSESGFDGYINIDDTENFRIGMNAKVKITTVDEPEVLSVKKSSVFKNDDDKSCVYEAEKQNDGTYKIREVEVEEGISKNLYIAVTGDGLEEGDYIVLNPSKYSDGDIVDVRVQNKNKDEAGDSND